MYAVSKKTKEPEKIKKPPKLFFKNLAPSVTRYNGQLSSCTISEKTNDSILRKLSDGWTEGQTDESDFTGRCRTNFESPKINTIIRYINNSSAKG